jgi:mercuric ion binding protein
MKTIRSIFIAISMFVSMSVFAQTKTDSFKVFGNCGMCKNRIEKASKLEGVTSADWNVDTKIMTVTYDSSKVTGDDIQKKIAAVGHDTDKYTAAEDVYKKLPGCCLYERKKANKDNGHSGHHQ